MLNPNQSAKKTYQPIMYITESHSKNSSDNPDNHQRPIRSFVLRQGRLTCAQKNALKKHAKRYIFPFANSDPLAHINHQPLDMPTDFSHQQRNQQTLQSISSSYAQQIVEIGFGNGKSLLQAGQQNPQHFFWGIEVHLPGVAGLMHRAHQTNIDNLSIIRTDAKQAMMIFPTHFCHQIRVFFPDPWHKKRHQKRRLLNQSFLSRLTSLLKYGGVLHITTDWPHYAEEITQHIRNITDLIPASEALCQTLIEAKVTSAYETRALRLEHPIFELIYQKYQR